MSASFEARKNSRATMITIGFAGLMGLLMFYWTWSIPIIIPPVTDPGILVELNLPEEPEVFAKAAGGGGGGNPVQATGEKGTAHAPPQPGTNDDAKDIEEDETEKETPPILKPVNPKPTATKINENKSIVKTEPKVEPLPPAPQKPKAVLGKTTGGTSNGESWNGAPRHLSAEWKRNVSTAVERSLESSTVTSPSLVTTSPPSR